MWGSIFLDIINQSNFNFGFPTLRTDSLLRISQWQYWWWFWFTYFFVLYFFLILRLTRMRFLQFLPKLVTSFRPHGKWGDLIVCLLPVSWCANILSNSNLILRMLEWQVESNLFTVRIRGKQWYWVYKFDIKSITDIISVPKNIGNNKWLISFMGDQLIADDYLHILQLRSTNLKLKEFWLKVNAVPLKKEKDIITTSFDNFLENSLDNLTTFEYDDISRWVHKPTGTNLPFKLKKMFLNNLNTRAIPESFDLLTVNFNVSQSEIFTKKPTENNFFTLKQKRYTRKNLIEPKYDDFFEQQNSILKEYDCLLAVKNKAALQNTPNFVTSSNDFIQNSDFIEKYNNSIISSHNYEDNYGYEFLKKSKILSEDISIILARRLLRTKKTLVLPSHMNLAIISNSYDVVHSWFVPGLGLKFDCIPGRATHHVLNIDNEGFYYGQCAEICGRYHHHMPIRMCALTYDHFLLWWNMFGLPKFLYLNNLSQTNKMQHTYRYTW